MWHFASFRAELACPSCDEIGSRSITVPTDGPMPAASASDGLPTSTECLHAGIVRECESCWETRAMALSAARRRFGAAGRMGRMDSGRGVTWDGEVLRDDEAQDGLENAILSELAREGHEPVPPHVSPTARVFVRLLGGRLVLVEQQRVLTTA